MSILIGYDTLHLDDRPYLEQWMNANLLMCIPYDDKTNWWLLFNNYNQLGDWVENIDLIVIFLYLLLLFLDNLFSFNIQFKSIEVQKQFIISKRMNDLNTNQDNFLENKDTIKVIYLILDIKFAEESLKKSL